MVLGHIGPCGVSMPKQNVYSKYILGIQDIIQTTSRGARRRQPALASSRPGRTGARGSGPGCRLLAASWPPGCLLLAADWFQRLVSYKLLSTIQSTSLSSKSAKSKPVAGERTERTKRGIKVIMNLDFFEPSTVVSCMPNQHLKQRNLLG